MTDYRALFSVVLLTFFKVLLNLKSFGFAAAAPLRRDNRAPHMKCSAAAVALISYALDI